MTVLKVPNVTATLATQIHVTSDVHKLIQSVHIDVQCIDISIV